MLVVKCMYLTIWLLMSAVDISLWAFEKLAPTDKGVIALEWRDVPCWYTPTKKAKNPWGQRAGPDRSPPGGWYPALDKRPYKLLQLAKSGRKLRGLNQ